MAKKEFERTCKKCQTVWYAPIESAPNRLEISGARMQATGERMSLFGGRKASAYEVRANSLETKRNRVLDAKRCPQCGSQSYSERRTKIT